MIALLAMVVVVVMWSYFQEKTDLPFTVNLVMM
jgi:hypothetical protein